MEVIIPFACGIAISKYVEIYRAHYANASNVLLALILCKQLNKYVFNDRLKVSSLSEESRR